MDYTDVEKNAKDRWSHSQSHYRQFKYEAIEIIEDWELNFCLGNALKYISRCEHKGSKRQDLEKALWYIQRELDNIK